jgi:hypothetical protein
MTPYRLYLVTAFKIRPAKGVEARKWWREKGAPDIKSKPWTKSLRCFAAQFGLGPDYYLESWQEIENYAAMDTMDQWFLDHPKEAEELAKLWREGEEYFEWGPTRLVGDWPESSLLPD